MPGKPSRKDPADLDQVKTLFRTSLKIDFRSSAAGLAKGKTKNRTFFWAVLFPNFWMSLFISLILFAKTDTAAYSLLVLGLSMVMTITTVLMVFLEVVIDPLDADILGHLPVSSSTFFLARLANLLFYVSLIGLSLTFIPSLFGAGVKGSGALFIPLFLLVSWLAHIAGALFVVLIFTFLLSRMNLERIKDILSYVQLAMLLLFFGIYQLLPRGLELTGKEGLTFSFGRPWSFLLPPAWFAGLVSGIMEGFDVPKTVHACLALGSLALLWLLGTRKLSLDYAATLQRTAEIIGKKEKSIASLSAKRNHFARTRSLLRGSGTEGVGFDLAARYFKRDRKAKGGLLTGFLISIPLIVLSLLSGEFKDPFTSPPHFSTLSAFAFLSFPGLSFQLSLYFTEDWKASWIFWASSIEDPSGLYRGALRFFLAGYLFPFFGLFFLFLCFFLPPFHAALVTLINLAFALDLAAFSSLFARDYPFSQEPEKTKSAGKMTLMIYSALALFFAFGATQYYAYTRPAIYPYILLFSIGLFFLLRFLGDYRMEQAMEKSEYYG